MPPSFHDPAESRPHFRLTRRGLLIGTGATLGLAVGYALWPRSYPGGMAAHAGETGFGPWLRIAPDGRTTIAVPQAEMGQGVMSAFAQIVADELGASWQLMAVEPATWHPVYANAAVLREFADGLPRLPQAFARHLPARTAEQLNFHLTAASTSLRNYHDALRLAAAEARQLLIAAAARKWGVAAARIDTANGAIFYKANRMRFGDAVALVDLSASPAKPALRAATARPLAGKVLPRIDLPPKVDGRARFGSDVRIPGLVYAAIRHGPIGSRLTALDSPEGIVAVNGADWGGNWFASIGHTNWEARQNLSRIKAQFSTGNRPDQAALQKILIDAARSSTGSVLVSRGSVDAIADPQNRVEAEYQLPFLAHASLEPLTATARLTGARAEIWGPTQSLSFAHQQVAQALQMPTEAVTIYPTLIGGGFGRAIEPDAMVEAALIARAVDRPVQLSWSRAEDFHNGRFRPPAIARARGNLAAGRIGTIDIRITSPVLLADLLGRQMPDIAPDADAGNAFDIAGLESIPYAIDNLRITHVPVRLPVPLGYWRGGAHNVSAFVLESLIDELAEIANADPLAFRLAHLREQPRAQQVLRAVAQAADWNAPLPKGRARGIALHQSFGSIAAMVVTASVDAGRPQIHDIVSAIDCGPVLAPDSVRAQLEGAAVMGLSAALFEASHFADGEVAPRDFDRYRVARMADMPSHVRTVLVNGADSDATAIGGVSETGLPPAAPALANALARATGKRARSLPLFDLYSG